MVAAVAANIFPNVKTEIFQWTIIKKLQFYNLEEGKAIIIFYVPLINGTFKLKSFVICVYNHYHIS